MARRKNVPKNFQSNKNWIVFYRQNGKTYRAIGGFLDGTMKFFLLDENNRILAEAKNPTGFWEVVLQQ